MYKKASNIVFYLILALLVFTPLARGSVHGWAIGIIFLTVLTSLSLYLAASIWTSSLGWIKTPLDYPILALFGLVLVSGHFSVHKPTSLLATVQLLSCIAVYYLVIHTATSRSRRTTLVYLLLAVSVFLALVGLLKSTGLNPFSWWEYKDLSYPPSFLSATFGNHNHLAGWLEMTIPLVFCFVIYRERGPMKTMALGLVLLLVAALILSQSRGGWIGMLAALMFMSTWLYRSNRMINSRWAFIMVNLVFVVGFFIVASSPVTDRMLTAETGLDDGSLASRVTAWHGVVDLAAANPLLGTGPGTFALSFPQYQPSGFQARFLHAHNDYLDFTAELGFGFLLVMAWMIIVLYRYGRRKMRSKSTMTRGITLGAMAGITAILVHSFVDFNLQIPANALLFTVLAALVAAPKMEPAK